MIRDVYIEVVLNGYIARVTVDKDGQWQEQHLVFHTFQQLTLWLEAVLVRPKPVAHPLAGVALSGESLSHAVGNSSSVTYVEPEPHE
jgi:hypothetical protein